MRTPALIPWLLMAACGKAPAANKAEPFAASMQPGQWEMVTQEPLPDMGGAPPEAQPGQSRTDLACLTPGQAADPTGALVGIGPEDRNCRFSDRTYAGGVIRIRATCREPGGDPSHAQFEMDGSFTATTFEGRLTMTAEGSNMPGAPGTQTLRVGSTVRGRRIGDCPDEPVGGNSSNGLDGG